MSESKHIALSQFTVGNGMDEEVRAAFLARPHEVDQAPGFIRMQVWQPQGDPSVFWLVTWWQDEASYRTWHHSHAYRQSHAYLPKGLKLVPGKQRIDHFKVVAD